VCASFRPMRVLLGNLEPMLRLGMSRVLADSGVEVAEEPRSAALAEAAAALAPDAIVLPLDDGGSADVRRRARTAAPGAKLILWARDESEMHIYDAGRAEPRRVVAGTADALLDELGHNQPRRGGE
jgi:DNA-binding NarL/FixJ family response regulator